MLEAYQKVLGGKKAGIANIQIYQTERQPALSVLKTNGDCELYPISRKVAKLLIDIGIGSENFYY